MNIEPSAGAILTVVFKRKRVFIWTTVCVAVLGAAYLIIATPKYRSEAAVVVRFEQAAVPNTDMARETTPEMTAANDRREIIQAHVDILTNPDLARRTIESVGLSAVYPKLLADPPWLLSWLPAGSGTPMDQAIVLFEKNFIADAELTGDVINVSYLHPNPKIAQAVLSKLIDLYMKQEAELYSASDFAFKSHETEQAAKRLGAAQVELRAYKAKWKITSFDDQVSDLIQARSDLSTSLQASEVSLEQAIQHRNELTHLLATVPANVTNSASGEKYHSYDDALSNLASLQQKEKEMMVTYRADSPLLAQLHASIATSQADVDRRRGELSRRDATEPNTVYQSIQTDLLRSTADAQSYAQSVAVQKAQQAEMDKDLSNLEASRTGYNDRLRDVQVADKAYQSLALHLEDARVAEGKLKNGISHGAVLTDPSLPYKVAKPRYLIMSVAFLLAALLAGVGAPITLELLDDRFTSSEQVVHAFHLPVLGTFDEAT